MKLKDTFMSSPICVKILYFKKFPFALQTIFSLHNLEADNFFNQLRLRTIFDEKGNPTIKNNGPSLSTENEAII